MRLRQQYGLFIHDNEGPLCKAFFPNLEEAKLQAQNLADKEGCESFIFDLVRFVEVAHCYPPQSVKGRSDGKKGSERRP